MMKGLRFLWIVCTIVLLQTRFGICGFQTTPISAQEEVVSSFQQRLDSLQVSYAKLMDQADILASQIELTKSKGLLSPGEHRKLEKQLQESQALENDVKRLESQIHETDDSYREAAAALIALYQKEIERLIRLAENEDVQKNPGPIRQLQQTFDKKQSLEIKLTPSKRTSYPVTAVDAQPWNTANDLRKKGDLLFDQEELLKEEIRLVERRIHSLQEEEKIRRKVTELTQEIDLFNEREELMGKASETALQRTADSRGTLQTEFNSDAGAEPSHIDKIQLALSGPTPRSITGLQDLIEQLKRYQGQMSSKADSLNKRARWFYDEAEKNRK